MTLRSQVGPITTRAFISRGGREGRTRQKRRGRVTFPRTRKQPPGTGEEQDSTDPTLEPPEGAQR